MNQPPNQTAAMWDPSTIAIDKAELSFFQGLDSPEPERCSLVVYSGGDTGRRLLLEPGRHSLGRSAAASLQIDGPGMSRLHAELTVHGGRVSLRDLGSANGSFVQDRRVVGSCLLEDGDLLRLGSVMLKFYEHRSIDAALHDRVYRLAMIDAGTGLYNRRYLHDALKRALRQARTRGRPLSVISCDLDRFKAVNDTHGHAAGDLVLRECAALIGTVVGAAGILGRQGGEEFLVLLPDMPLAPAQALAERIRSTVAAHGFTLATQGVGGRRGTVHHQTLSLGVAEWSDAMLDAGDLLGAADRQLYQAKHAGRDRVGA
jgi:diguanylate cyclase (GGDEF)-like protein